MTVSGLSLVLQTGHPEEARPQVRFDLPVTGLAAQIRPFVRVRFVVVQLLTAIVVKNIAPLFCPNGPMLP